MPILPACPATTVLLRLLLFVTATAMIHCSGDVDVNGDGVISYEEFKAMMQGVNSHSSRYK